MLLDVEFGSMDCFLKMLRFMLDSLTETTLFSLKLLADSTIWDLGDKNLIACFILTI